MKYDIVYIDETWPETNAKSTYSLKLYTTVQVQDFRGGGTNRGDEERAKHAHGTCLGEIPPLRSLSDSKTSAVLINRLSPT